MFGVAAKRLSLFPQAPPAVEPMAIPLTRMTLKQAGQTKRFQMLVEDYSVFAAEIYI